MSRTLAIVLIVVAFGLGAGAGILGFLWATGGSAEESQDVSEAVATLSLDAATPTPGLADAFGAQFEALSGQLEALSTQVAQNAVDVAAQIDSLSTVMASSAQAAAPETTVTEDVAALEPTPVPTEEATAEATEEAAAPAGDEAAAGEARRGLFRIVSEDSEARFLIDEILMGNPVTVVGTTNRVAGDIIVNFDDPTTSEIGEIAINARTLRTDNEFRDQAIRSRILQSARDEFEFVTFVPTSFTALSSDPVAVGDSAQFQITGDLTIRGETRSIVFETTVNITAPDRIEGTATTTILYEDFNISIQAPPTVSGIGDEVILEIEFVATLVEGTPA
ncbi:MAG: YceI family protein [Anaerolineae bacterium]